MKKSRILKDFDFYIEEYMYFCRSRQLRPKTMQSYEGKDRIREMLVSVMDQLSDEEVESLMEMFGL